MLIIILLPQMVMWRRWKLGFF